MRASVVGRMLDDDGNGVPDTIVEIWQANSVGRYIHERDQHPAPLDPNCIGAGRCKTDEDGSYRFLAITPGAYPWRNHPNAWRPAHIHFALFGPAFVTRLIAQMYFPGDPLFELDLIMGSVPREHWHRMFADHAHDVTEEEWALFHRFEIVLRGPDATPSKPPEPETSPELPTDSLADRRALLPLRVDARRGGRCRSRPGSRDPDRDGRPGRRRRGRGRPRRDGRDLAGRWCGLLPPSRGRSALRRAVIVHQLRAR